MNVSEFCKYTNLHPQTIQNYIAKFRNTMKANVDLQEEISPWQQAKLCKEFPDHRKLAIITCDEDENFRVDWIGAWNGRLRKAGERTFSGSYKKAMKELQKPDRPEGFDSYPSRDAIREEMTKQTEDHKQALIDKGRVHEDGSIQTDAELAATQDKTSLPLPLGRRPDEPVMLKKKTPAPRPEVVPELGETVEAEPDPTMLTNQSKNLLAEDKKMSEELARLEGKSHKPSAPLDLFPIEDFDEVVEKEEQKEIEPVEMPIPIVVKPKKVEATKKKKAKVTKKKTIKQGVVSNAE